MPVPVYRAAPAPDTERWLRINPPLVVEWLVRFLRAEFSQRGFDRAVIGLSGGVDSAVSAALAARAFGGENVLAVRMPYRLSSPESLSDAELVADHFGLRCETVDMTAMVDGYWCEARENGDSLRLGNVCARCRMTVLYDLSARDRALPVGTSNKTERLMGYYTWHADDAPAVNPLGDLFKTQVWAVARELGVPERVVSKPPTADLVPGQTDEGDFGLDYATVDAILIQLVRGNPASKLVEWGFDKGAVATVLRRLEGTHWKRRLPTSAMVSDTAVNEYYLRPVDDR
ncbi:MAG: NAD+ synthase [Fimbriimonadaceae bacterium]|nr:NAD+ synthase [Fimbriimonadaceae bacterium]QYK59548.1 MAG: NAD+ synthase [Fimbriimonadaceae bacterium]